MRRLMVAALPTPTRRNLERFRGLEGRTRIIAARFLIVKVEFQYVAIHLFYINFYLL